ncbi:T9SS type A sorting domain-containing protein [bacterium]|nr:T9SS type A sorting domain-containing protein [bacterium]MBU1985187.1 T9SS type A sorting domain-containing protein [bacterium]
MLQFVSPEGQTLDSIEWYLSSSPQMVRTGTSLFISFHDWNSGQQALVWVSENGNVLHRQQEDHLEVPFAYNVGDTAMLVEYVQRIDEDWMWRRLSVHGYNTQGLRVLSDTLLWDTLDSGPAPQHVFAGSDFDMQNRELLAVSVTARSIQYPDSYRVQVVRYADGEVNVQEPFDPGPPPPQGYLRGFKVAHGENGGGVLAWFGIRIYEHLSLNLRAFNANGQLYDVTHNIALDPNLLPSEMDLTVHGGTVYTAYALSTGIDSLRGVWLAGFPESELLPVSVPPNALPNLLGLSAYPNPFNSVTRIDYVVPQMGDVSLTVFDRLGREVTTLSRGMQTAGEHSILWNADGVSSGIYFVRMNSGGTTNTCKLVLIR